MAGYDVVVIGSGLGGLSAAVMLAKEGLRVLVVEQHRVVGGCLQSFRRGEYLLDTGIHYVGSLAEGRILNQYFRYLGVMDRLQLQRLDDAGYDHIHLHDGTTYRHAAGYENYVEELAAAFPHEREGLKAFCRQMKQVGDLIDPEVLRSGRLSAGGIEFMSLSVAEELERLISDERLRQVLAGSVPLYAGQRNRSSFYEHAMINHSNIEGAYSFVGGTQQLADLLADEIRRHGGEVRLSAEVTRIHLEGDRAEWLELNGEERIDTKWILSSIHPVRTFALLENNTVIKRAFFSRLNALENSYGLFTVYLLLKRGSVPYENSNHYYYNAEDVWSHRADYRGVNLPVVLFSMQPSANGYSDVATLLVPMLREDMAQWEASRVGRRGEEYEAFKAHFAERVIDFVAQYRPELKGQIAAIHTASPLTYRDYTATPDGSAYGIVKDYHNPIVNHLPARTRIQNLLLAGQNLNVHGALGVVVSSAVSCSELLGVEYLAKKIGNA